MDLNPQVVRLVGTPGFTRTDLHRRFIRAARSVLERDAVQEDREPEMVMKVNVQDALNRLTVCPVCGAGLTVYPDYPTERSCHCGDFTITEVWTNGDVTFEFKMIGHLEEGETPVSPDLEDDVKA